MTVGGTNDVSNVEVKAGIGWEKAAQVWYRTNTHSLMMTSGFQDAAHANLASADDLALTQSERNIIEGAWIAVGVLDGACAEMTPEAAGGSSGASPAKAGGAAAPKATGDGARSGAGAPPTPPGCNAGAAAGSDRGDHARVLIVAIAALLVTKRRQQS